MGRLSERVVATTRDGDADDPLNRALSTEGAKVLVWPTLRFEDTADPLPMRMALGRLTEFDWVAFTSVRAVKAVCRFVGPPQKRPRVAAVGDSTAHSLRSRGWPVDVVGDGEGALGLARAMARAGGLKGAAVLFPAGSLAGPILQAELAARGAQAFRVEAYRTRVAPPAGESVWADLARGVHAVVFTSPSAVQGLEEALRLDFAAALGPCAVVACGSTTGAALERAGVRVAATAPSPNAIGVVEACIRAIEQRHESK